MQPMIGPAIDAELDYRRERLARAMSRSRHNAGYGDLRGRRPRRHLHLSYRHPREDGLM